MAAILVVERADDLVVDVGDGEGGLEGRAGRHGAEVEVEVELWWAAAVVTAASSKQLK